MEQMDDNGSDDCDDENDGKITVVRFDRIPRFLAHTGGTVVQGGVSTAYLLRAVNIAFAPRHPLCRLRVMFLRPFAPGDDKRALCTGLFWHLRQSGTKLNLYHKIEE